MEELNDSGEADEIEEDEDKIDGPGEDIVLEGSELIESSLDSSMHNILQAVVDPVEWKTELERVGPKLRANQHQNSNEWRSHVDQTLTNKLQIEKIVVETQSELQLMFK